MKKTILLATDFSPAADNAADYAADMALVIHADLLLLHVYQPPVSYSEIPMLINLADVKAAAENDILALKGKLTRRSDDKLTIETEVRLGNLTHEMKEVCERVNPYAVVMGSQGTSAAELFLFGSRTIHAMKHLEWPLVSVPKGASFSAVKRIGLACDFENMVDMISPAEIKGLVNDFHAELHILNTNKNKSFKPETVFESGLLQEMLHELDPQYHFIAHEDTDEGIMGFAEKNNIDLLVVIPKRHNLVEKLLHKSHTKQFVLHSHVPVMALHHNHG